MKNILMVLGALLDKESELVLDEDHYEIVLEDLIHNGVNEEPVVRRMPAETAGITVFSTLEDLLKIEKERYHNDDTINTPMNTSLIIRDKINNFDLGTIKVQWWKNTVYVFDTVVYYNGDAALKVKISYADLIQKAV